MDRSLYQSILKRTVNDALLSKSVRTGHKKSLGGIVMEDYILSCSSTADMTNGYYSSRDIHHIDCKYTIGGKTYDESMGESVPLSDF